MSLLPPRDDPWVAVEVDVLDVDNNEITLRMSNRGTLTRTVSGVLHQYDPRLSGLPIQLGMSINVTQYGQPVRTQPNGGTIQFAIDETIWHWFQDYFWIARTFRFYEGEAPDPLVPRADVDADLALVYVGRVSGLQHDTLTGTIQTTDASYTLNHPLVTDFYSVNFPVGIQGLPKPYLWGRAHAIQPVLEDETTQTYRVSARPGGLDAIYEVRIGGVPWEQVSGTPAQAQWAPDLADGTFLLGAPPLGLDIRVDAKQGTFTVAGLITAIIQANGGTVDASVMAALDNAAPGAAALVTTTQPVNLLTAIDDFVNAAGCWWGVGALGKFIAGTISTPAALPDFLLGNAEIKTLGLNTIQPLAWRIRVGYSRNWQTETSFASAVLQADQERYAKPALVYEPHFENTNALAVEPLAVDVPLLLGTSTASADAAAEQLRLRLAWGQDRTIFDATAWLRPEDVVLYRTVGLDYMMVSGVFRIVSAIRAIGGGPATLQLWGTIGPPPPEPPPPSPGIIGMGNWVRPVGGTSGQFIVGVDCPDTVTFVWVRIVGGGGGGAACYTPDGGTAYSGGGGGAGAYNEDVLSVSNGQSIPWSVGGGAAGGPAGLSGNAASGGATQFGAIIAGGGQGGILQIGQSVNGGAGGVAAGGSVPLRGGDGGSGFFDNGHSGINVGSPPYLLGVYTANGGASAFGGGDRAVNVLNPAGAPGSGGGGVAAPNFTVAGGGGSDGLIIVLWFQT